MCNSECTSCIFGGFWYFGAVTIMIAKYSYFLDMNALADAIPENAYGRLGGNMAPTYSTYATSMAPEPKTAAAWSMVK